MVRIVWLFYGGKLPGKIFVYVRTFSEYKTEIYVGESFSLLDTEQRNEITFPSDTKNTISWKFLSKDECSTGDQTRLTYNCAHLRLNNKKNKNELSQKGPRDWALILEKSDLTNFLAIPKFLG